MTTMIPNEETAPRADDADRTLLQIQNRLWQLTGQLDQVQTQFEALRTDAGDNHIQVTALVNAFTDGRLLRPVHERLAELISALDSTQEQLTALNDSIATVAQREQMEQLHQSIAQTARQEQLEQFIDMVAKQGQLERLIEVVAGQGQLNEVADSVKKLTRTQFKANTLAESKEQQVESALGTLREIVTRREATQSQLQPQNAQTGNTAQSEIRSAARAEFAAELLPALDSIELALSNGATVLARQQVTLATLLADTSKATAPQFVVASPGFWQRLFRPEMPSPTTSTIVPSGPAPEAVQEVFTTLTGAFTAWLRGLDLVRDRFSALLSKEEIHPIEALYQPFDPRLHVAVETEARNDVEANTVVRVLRQGYRQRNRVLRYVEVVVARKTEPIA